MKRIFTLLLLLGSLFAPVIGQSISLYDESRVASIFVVLPTDSLQKMIAELDNDYYYHASFIFNDGVVQDTLENIGLRLRGNTSLLSQKKSFKISFNEYAQGREYQGVRKLNLLGSHNDPTMIREKLFYNVWEKAGMPQRRASFVKLYVNGLYYGLYSNMEEIDKQWLTRAYGNNDGNLYKCTYPADLMYLGNYTSIYKTILNNPETRAYDLVTNEAADDYAGLVELIRRLDQPVNAAFAANISAVLNVESVLKSFALDVATGNWDDYFYNKNNYYLYDNPATGRFEFITYDTDNTFGVDWLGKDWAKRNCRQWTPAAPQSRPLASKLLAVPAFFNQYVHYLDSITRFIVHPDSIFPRIDYYHQLITPAAVADTYRALDWGYDLADFHQGFTQTIDGHTPYGIKPFLELRYDSTVRQTAHLLSATTNPTLLPLEVSIYPNPASDWVLIQSQASFSGDFLYGALQDVYGRTLKTWTWQASTTPFTLSLLDVPAGMYQIQLHTAGRQGNWLVLKTSGR
jgi:spore coat protein H